MVVLMRPRGRRCCRTCAGILPCVDVLETNSIHVADGGIDDECDLEQV